MTDLAKFRQKKDYQKAKQNKIQSPNDKLSCVDCKTPVKNGLLCDSCIKSRLSTDFRPIASKQLIKEALNNFDQQSFESLYPNLQERPTSQNHIKDFLQQLKNTPSQLSYNDKHSYEPKHQAPSKINKFVKWLGDLHKNVKQNAPQSPIAEPQPIAESQPIAEPQPQNISSIYNKPPSVPPQFKREDIRNNKPPSVLPQYKQEPFAKAAQLINKFLEENSK